MFPLKCCGRCIRQCVGQFGCYSVVVVVHSQIRELQKHPESKVLLLSALGESRWFTQLYSLCLSAAN